ncbi:hypothetical protein BSL78_13439 [Apostichopus japonicus]|uniref:Uncharacterized protein n=1 Tax=Stichopus japonicus TaxID=307972 RepID=A0A2G8KP21_STIJA|nr:hypothetical protein BSL78_13439 [Apostichopus japonicus]
MEKCVSSFGMIDLQGLQVQQTTDPGDVGWGRIGGCKAKTESTYGNMTAVLGDMFDIAIMDNPFDHNGPAVIVQSAYDGPLTPTELISPTAFSLLPDESDITEVPCKDLLPSFIKIQESNVCEGNAPEKKDIMAAQALLDISPTTSGEDKLFPPTDNVTVVSEALGVSFTPHSRSDDSVKSEYEVEVPQTSVTDHSDLHGTSSSKTHRVTLFQGSANF